MHRPHLTPRHTPDDKHHQPPAAAAAQAQPRHRVCDGAKDAAAAAASRPRAATPRTPRCCAGQAAWPRPVEAAAVGAGTGHARCWVACTKVVSNIYCARAPGRQSMFVYSRQSVCVCVYQLSVEKRITSEDVLVRGKLDGLAV